MLSKWERAERIERLKVIRVVDSLNIQPGIRVADIGAGSGLFSRPMAKKTGRQGRLYAVDVNPDYLQYVKESAAKDNINNIQTVLTNKDDLQLPGTVDLVFICDALHHVADKQAFLSKIEPFLNDNGRIAIIDFKKNWPEGHEKMVYQAGQLIGWMNRIGFGLYSEYDFLENEFFMIFTRSSIEI
jgi:ubiquinone/menaquinone biosynthesis C-methylase UbiE